MNHREFGSGRKEFERKVARAWHAAGSPYLLICVSGGADSVALLHSLLAATHKEELITVLHCDFHLRGEESERDRLFVEELCGRLGVPVKVKHFDVESYRKEHPCSLETACRELRYGWFREEADTARTRFGKARIVTGHNSDDNIETLLLNLFRGAGLHGLKGMLPDTGEILRPLLSISRHEILSYLYDIAETTIETPGYVTDSSNIASDFRRNFIRNEVLPLVESRWPGVRKAINRTLSALRDEDALLASLPASRELSLDSIRSSAGATTLVHRLIAPHGGNSDQAREAAEAATRIPFQSGKLWRLKDGSRLSLERDAFRILSAHPEAEGYTPAFCWGKVKMTADEHRIMRSDRSQLRIWLPLPPENYHLRRCQRGDRMKPLGMGGSRLLSDMMKDAHMDRGEKERQWVLTDATTGEIIWAPGLRRSRLHLLSPDAEYAYRAEMISTSIGEESHKKDSFPKNF